MKRLLLIAVTALSAQLLPAQNTVPDSLAKAIKVAGADSATVSKLKLQLGVFYYNNGVFDTSLLLLNQAAAIALAHTDNNTYTKALNNIGNVYSDKGNNTEALKYYQQALTLSEDANDQNQVAEIEKNIGALYLSWKRFTEALFHYEKAKTIAIQTGNKLLEADCYNNIGTAYEQQLKYPEALDVYKKALDYYTSVQNKSRMAMALSNVAIVYKFLKRYQPAVDYNLKGLALAREMKSQWTEAAILNNIGSIYSSWGKYAEAIDYCNQSIVLSRRMNAIEIVYNAYETMGEAATSAGDYKAAVSYYKAYMSAKDSFVTAESNRQLSELQTRYDSEKKDKQIVQQGFELTKRNYLLWTMISLLLLGSLLAYSYYRRYKLRKEKQLQQEVIKQQDIAVKAVLQAEENERRRIAGELHDGVGQLMSAARMNLSAFENDIAIAGDDKKQKLEKIISLVDEGCREVRMVSHNMMPNALLKSGLANAVRDFIEKIDNNIIQVDLYSEGLNDRLDANIETVLYRVIQEAVNNVIKHSGANHLDISLVKENNNILVTIEDNGKGFDTDQKEKFSGIGLKNIFTRIAYLKGEVEINSSFGRGTFIGISVPLS